jgi:3-dehydroquinate synthase
MDPLAPSDNPGSPRRVFLIGLSGSGKSTVGPLLAQRMGVRFLDTDAEIERRTGQSVDEIFRTQGEPRFREIEREVFVTCCHPEAAVVATGGGVPLDAQSRRDMLTSGRVVWLDAPIELLAERLVADSAEARPLLAGDAAQRLTELRDQRRPFYASLGHRLEATLPPAALVDDIIEILGRDGALSIKNLESGPGTPSTASQGATVLRPLPDPVVVRTPSLTYPVFIGSGILDRTGEALRQAGLSGTLHVIADERVARLHGDHLRAALSEHEQRWYLVPSGEEHKTLVEADRLFDAILAQRPERRDVVVAFGGGVIGDLAGFVAATLLRGLRFVQLPTTLLAHVDSSVGGKVAVDHPRGKNLIGAFHQPSLVIADVELLRTLPAREIAAGWAEVVKIAVVQDATLFEQIERDVEYLPSLDRVRTVRAIRRAVELKAALVEKDERDLTGLRAILNYGHTIGHALEAATRYDTLLHGEAVAIGLGGAAHIAVGMGLHPADAVARQQHLMERLGLPMVCSSASPEEVRAAMGLDKKRADGKTVWVLPNGLGRAQLSADVPPGLVDEAISLTTGGVSV